MKDIKLYIGTTEADLSDGENILYNYEVKSLTNPTAVKNSFSKSLTLPNTPTNDRIFGHYWNVERRVGSGGDNAGVDFNASKKAPFKVYANGELCEEGYIKLDKVNRTGNNISYSCSLYGGLGDFFYALSQNANTGEELRLCDLDYYTGGTEEFNFVVSANTVYEAWEALRNGTDGKWQHINFMPAYNGYPDDFDADKVIINLSGTTLQRNDGPYTPKDGCVLASLPEELTEWEMRDLRSYHQRPCIRMKSIIQACCDPAQNGGYTVALDPDFFSDSNPYYSKTWLSLPLVKNLEYTNTEQVMSGASLIGLTTTGDTSGMMYQDLRFDIGEFSSVAPNNISMNVNMFVNNPIRQGSIEIDPWNEWMTHIDAHYTSFVWFWRNNGDGYHPNNWYCLGSLFVQLIALNGDVVVGASEALNLTSPIRHNGKTIFGENSKYSEENRFKPFLGKNIVNVLGGFYDDGFRRDGQNTPADLTLTINSLNGPVSDLKIVFFYGATDAKIKRYGRTAIFTVDQDSDIIELGGPDVGSYSPNHPSMLTVGVKSTNFKAVLGESIGRSGSEVTKALLLNTEGSPASYLLSYCKTFGLYFTKDKDSNTIRIETRKTFYDRDDVVNLSEMIDRSREITIDPLAFSTKWYQLLHEQDETEKYKQYRSAKAIEYGSKVYNTGYEFSTEKKNLLEDSVIRGGIEVLERSKYYTVYNNDKSQRNWMGMGLTYNLYFGDSASTVTAPMVNGGSLLGLNEGEAMKYYDLFPKLQFHAEENSPTDGNNVLVFFSGMKDTQSGRTNPVNYILSDDNRWQTLLNDGTPCWLFTTSEDIGGIPVAKTLRYIPVFERYLTNAGSGKVDKSLDFGTAQELYIPNYAITEESNIASSFWTDYLTDLFDPDTKILTCYVRTTERVGTPWLKRFYWFDNALWVCNKIDEYDFLNMGTTKMEFIKVQDVGDYNSVTQEESVSITLTANNYIVLEGGGVVTLTVTVSNGGSWRLIAPQGVVLSATGGTGNGSVTATFPSNSELTFKNWVFTVSTTDGKATASATIRQRYFGDTTFYPFKDRIIIPASGGREVVDFVWQNQGEDYISGYTKSAGGADFDVDITQYQRENRAVLTFSANTGSTVLHNRIDFYDNENNIVRSVGVDQLPTLEPFNASGGNDTIILEYTTGATFTDKPSWIDITETEDGQYEIKVRDNIYDSENTATITVSNEAGSSAPLVITQEAGEGTGGCGGCCNTGVSPLNLYFDSTGGTKYITVNLSGSWWATTSGGFFTISQDTGDAGVSIIAVSTSNNTGNTLNGTITVNGDIPVVVTITQLGESTVEDIIVTPSTLTLPSSGGTQEIGIQYVGRNGYGIIPVVSSSAVSATSISWTGESGTMTVSVPQNELTTSQTITVSFNGRNASGSTVITQDAGPRYASVSALNMTYGAQDTTGLNGVTSNTPWTATTSAPWISVSPSSGDSGYTGIVVTTTQNSDLTSRVGYVYVSDMDNNLLATITVHQFGLEEELSVSPSTLTFDSTGGALTFTITSNTNWTIE